MSSITSTQESEGFKGKRAEREEGGPSKNNQSDLNQSVSEGNTYDNFSTKDIQISPMTIMTFRWVFWR